MASTAAVTTVNVEKVYPFYLIWTKTGRNPVVSHGSLAKAQEEALRLAAKFPDKRFFVVQAVTRAWVNEAADRVRRPQSEVEWLGLEGGA